MVDVYCPNLYCTQLYKRLSARCSVPYNQGLLYKIPNPKLYTLYSILHVLHVSNMMCYMVDAPFTVAMFLSP